MKKILLFDTAIATTNIGDEIILKSIREGLASILYDAFQFRMGTHIENYNPIQMIHNWQYENMCKDADYKFICGTNLLESDLHWRRPQWHLHSYNRKLYEGSVLVGVGRTSDYLSFSNRTKNLYLKILSKKYKHSVRDEKTREVLESIGIRAINTGCPTLWNMTQDKCTLIPAKKAKNCIISVSGYDNQKNYKEDSLFLKIIKRNYEKVFVWIQTALDEKYFKTLQGSDNVERIFSLEKYADILDNWEIDYIGTRLHGGVFAMQHNIRSLIIAIDERAIGFYESNNLPIIKREEIGVQLENMIYGRWNTKIHINQEAINEFLNQFK